VCVEKLDDFYGKDFEDIVRAIIAIQKATRSLQARDNCVFCVASLLAYVSLSFV
jgi:hypothetical protein